MRGQVTQRGESKARTWRHDVVEEKRSGGAHSEKSRQIRKRGRSGSVDREGRVYEAEKEASQLFRRVSCCSSEGRGGGVRNPRGKRNMERKLQKQEEERGNHRLAIERRHGNGDDTVKRETQTHRSGVDAQRRSQSNVKRDKETGRLRDRTKREKTSTSNPTRDSRHLWPVSSSCSPFEYIEWHACRPRRAARAFDGQHYCGPVRSARE